MGVNLAFQLSDETLKSSYCPFHNFVVVPKWIIDKTITRKGWQNIQLAISRSPQPATPNPDTVAQTYFLVFLGFWRTTFTNFFRRFYQNLLHFNLLLTLNVSVRLVELVNTSMCSKRRKKTKKIVQNCYVRFSRI